MLKQRLILKYTLHCTRSKFSLSPGSKKAESASIPTTLTCCLRGTQPTAVSCCDQTRWQTSSSTMGRSQRLTTRSSTSGRVCACRMSICRRMPLTGQVQCACIVTRSLTGAPSPARTPWIQSMSNELHLRIGIRAPRTLRKSTPTLRRKTLKETLLLTKSSRIPTQGCATLMARRC